MIYSQDEETAIAKCFIRRGRLSAAPKPSYLQPHWEGRYHKVA
jgi:hypothetical protein